MLHRFMELDFHLDAESLVLSTEDVIIPLWSIIAKSTISAALVSILYQLRIRNQAFSPEAFFGFSADTAPDASASVLSSVCSALSSVSSLFFCLVIVLVGKNLLVDIDCLRRFSNITCFPLLIQKTSLTVP